MVKFRPDPIDVEVGERVRRRRRQLGMSQTDLSKAIGLSFQQVQKYERAANRISAPVLVMIAARLETTVAELLGETPDPSAARVSQTELATPGAIELLDCFVRIEPPQRRMLLLLATGLAREAGRAPTKTQDDDAEG
jgi:transcriptional regulator with XRE-family HTH domain